MSNKILIKKNTSQGNEPTTSDLDLGELAVNTFDGKIFMKVDNGTEEIVAFTAGIDTDNFVTTDTDQTITGTKTFDNPIFVGTASIGNKLRLNASNQTGVLEFNSTGVAIIRNQGGASSLVFEASGGDVSHRFYTNGNMEFEGAIIAGEVPAARLTGTISDARLPTTQSGKVFFTSTSVAASTDDSREFRVSTNRGQVAMTTSGTSNDLSFIIQRDPATSGSRNKILMFRDGSVTLGYDTQQTFRTADPTSSLGSGAEIRDGSNEWQPAGLGVMPALNVGSNRNLSSADMGYQLRSNTSGLTYTVLDSVPIGWTVVLQNFSSGSQTVQVSGSLTTIRLFNGTNTTGSSFNIGPYSVATVTRVTAGALYMWGSIITS